MNCFRCPRTAEIPTRNSHPLQFFNVSVSYMSEGEVPAFWTRSIVHLMGARGVTQPVHGWNKASHRSCFLMFHLPVLYFRWKFFNLLSLYINIYIYKLLYRTSRHTMHTYAERLKSKINPENPTPYPKLSFSWVYTKKSLPKIKYIQC